VELNGSLQAFILADVFQLLAQQKATGKLEVRRGDRVGYMILREGSIVAAVEGEETLQRKLLNAMLTLRRLPEREVNRLRELHAQNPVRLCGDLITNRRVGEEELVAMARSTVEDISCGLFTWDSGTYRFESMTTVREYVLAGVLLPADAVVMEAMRRDDEAKRLFGQISPDMIFAPASREHQLGAIPQDLAGILSAPDSYLLSFIDGLTSVEGIVEGSCLCRYRVYDTLLRLWTNNVIAPLPAKVAQSIQAASSKVDGGIDTARIRTLALAVGGSLLAVLIVAFLGVAVFQNMLMRKKTIASTKVRTEIEVMAARQKAQIAKLQFHAVKGRRAESESDLTREEYLYPRDLAPLRPSGSRRSKATP
jgi:hypothetical protein